MNERIWDINMEEKEVILVISYGQYLLAPKSRFCTSVTNFLFSDIKELLELAMV